VFSCCNRVGVGSIRFFFVLVLFVFSHYNNNTKGRNFFWVLLFMFSCCKRDMRCKIIFLGLFLLCIFIVKGIWDLKIYYGLYIVFSYRKGIQSATKKFVFLKIWFLTTIRFGSAIIFWGIFKLCFLPTTRIRGTKKFLFILCFFPLLQKNW
jgi:hypothetical protein